jgi:hypothetical protein
MNGFEVITIYTSKFVRKKPYLTTYWISKIFPGRTRTLFFGTEGSEGEGKGRKEKRERIEKR